VFDLQTAVAESFGYKTVTHRRRPHRVARQRSADEALLLGGQGVTQLNQILLLNIEERLNPSKAEPRPSTSASTTRPA
jgi:[protein-PII] uridylyltransferase